MPVLYILGGSNGVGKTTWYQTGIEKNYISHDLPFINVDNIVIKELNKKYSPANIGLAEQLAREKMTVLIKANKDFMIESNLAKASDYEWIENMRKHRYETILYFLCTDDVQINKNRVQQRVTEGGHDISSNIIEHRYRMGLTYIKSKILDFTEARIIDVSGDIAIEMAFLKEGKILSTYPNLPAWAKECLYIAERLQEKRAGL
jgi:predicted ABC-type ATPase